MSSISEEPLIIHTEDYKTELNPKWNLIPILPKVAMVWGVTGQDGSYLSEFLLKKGYTVIGVKRRTSYDNTERLKEVKNNSNFTLVEGDICDSGNVFSLIKKYQPTECYNLAAQSHVHTSFEQPSYTFQVNTLGELNILEGIRQFSPHTKHYFAGTSEEFGNNYSVDQFGKKYQDEDCEFDPSSPYAVSKVAAHNLVNLYRDAYNLHANVGILFNHGSPRRGEEFVTRKISKYVAQLNCWMKKYGQSKSVMKCLKEVGHLHLGNLDACRDWSHAKDMVRGMWLMLQQEKPRDYVLASERTHSVRQFLDEAFNYIDVNWKPFVKIDDKFKRPKDVEYLCGRATRAKEELDWKPQICFSFLVKNMVQADIDLLGDKR